MPGSEYWLIIIITNAMYLHTLNWRDRHRGIIVIVDVYTQFNNCVSLSNAVADASLGDYAALSMPLSAGATE